MILNDVNCRVCTNVYSTLFFTPNIKVLNTVEWIVEDLYVAKCEKYSATRRYKISDRELILLQLF